MDNSGSLSGVSRLQSFTFTNRAWRKKNPEMKWLLHLTIQFCFSLLGIVPIDPNAGNIQVNIAVGESGQIFNGSATIKKGKTLLDVLQTLQSNSTFRQVHVYI